MIFTELSDKVSDLYYLTGVETYGRLVKNDDLRVAEYGLGNAHTLSVAL